MYDDAKKILWKGIKDGGEEEIAIFLYYKQPHKTASCESNDVQARWGTAAKNPNYRYSDRAETECESGMRRTKPGTIPYVTDTVCVDCYLA